MITFENIIKKNISNYIQPRRSQIYVGFQCHQKCGFCYYKHKCTDQMFEINDIKKQIDFAIDYGIHDFEITGGEPSEHKQLRDICQYIRNKVNGKIAIITNGGLYNCNIFDLIDEVLVSYHLGKNDKTYCKDIFPLGSTWNKVKKTIDKAKSNNLIIRTNTVLGKFNLFGIEYIIQDLIELNPNIINFLPVNLFDQAKHMSDNIDYDLFRYKIKNTIDFLKNNLKNTYIFVRYMPFCNMEGYEQYIVGHLQHIYDWFDWNRELDGTEIINMSNDKEKYLNKLGYYGKTSLKNVFDTREKLYSKTSKCLTCKYNIICDGVEKTHDNSLIKYIQSSHGKIIKDPLFFIKNITQEIYNNLYNI